MEILVTLVVGLIVGAIAKLAMPGKDPGGIVVTMLFGVAGSFLAGMLGRALGWYVVDCGPGVIAAVIGAAMLLAIYRAVVGSRTLAV